MTNSFDPSDLSNLYFPVDNSTTESSADSSGSARIHIGHIQVQQCQHGRGLFATRDIAVGELLFIAIPSANATVADIFHDAGNGVAEASEQTLVNAILSQQEHDMSLRRVLDFLQQPTLDVDIDANDLLPLLAGAPAEVTSQEHHNFRTFSREDTVQIVRRNAFGPDFNTPQSIQASWERDDTPYLPKRLLSLYALPAMINHSCIPNAVRVFVGSERMIVHACRTIPKGAEITWSYIPLIQPNRRQLLQDTHGFICQCERCEAESSIMFPDTVFNAVEDLEHWIQSLPTNEKKRYVRVCYLSVYLNELNQSDSQPDAKRWIPLGMQLHLALAACHNASTEHLSVLHFLYELEKDTKKRTFWADQLRRTVMTRYGSMGNDIGMVRRILQHTRTVLRQRNGLQRIEQSGGNPFI